MRHVVPGTLAVSVCLLVAACSSSGPAASRSTRSAVSGGDDGQADAADGAAGDDGNGADGDDGGDQADASSPANESCYGVFTWLQKDAYSNTGGRSTALWPPH